MFLLLLICYNFTISDDAVKDGTQDDDDEEPMDLESSENLFELNSDLLSMLRSGYRRTYEHRQKSVIFHLFKIPKFKSYL